MHIPTRDQLLSVATSKASQRVGIGMLAFDAVWTAVTKLFEHIMLQWVAERLGDVPMLRWAIVHPFRLFVALGLSYCLIVILVALRQSRKTQDSPIPERAVEPASPTISQGTVGDRHSTQHCGEQGRSRYDSGSFTLALA